MGWLLCRAHSVNHAPRRASRKRGPAGVIIGPRPVSMIPLYIYGSHPAEPVLECAAHGQPLRVTAHAQAQLALVVLLHGADGADAHDRAAMHLPEHLGIERRQQFLEGRADVSLAVAGDDARVLVL